jgi:hypothetical protein
MPDYDFDEFHREDDITNLNDNEYSNTTSAFETPKKEPVVAETTTNLEDSDALKW